MLGLFHLRPIASQRRARPCHAAWPTPIIGTVDQRPRRAPLGMKKWSGLVSGRDEPILAPWSRSSTR
jgi:hypothetical protein